MSRLIRFGFVAFAAMIATFGLTLQGQAQPLDRDNYEIVALESGQTTSHAVYHKTLRAADYLKDEILVVNPVATTQYAKDDYTQRHLPIGTEIWVPKSMVKTFEYQIPASSATMTAVCSKLTAGGQKIAVSDCASTLERVNSDLIRRANGNIAEMAAIFVPSDFQIKNNAAATEPERSAAANHGQQAPPPADNSPLWIGYLISGVVAGIVVLFLKKIRKKPRASPETETSSPDHSFARQFMERFCSAAETGDEFTNEFVVNQADRLICVDITPKRDNELLDWPEQKEKILSILDQIMRESFAGGYQVDDIESPKKDGSGVSFWLKAKSEPSILQLVPESSKPIPFYESFDRKDLDVVIEEVKKEK